MVTLKGKHVMMVLHRRGNMPREDDSSPSISLEALMATLMVDAYEGCDIKIIDVPRNYSNADITNDKYTPGLSLRGN